MDVLMERIKEAEHFRDRYFKEHPNSTLAEKSKSVRERVIPLLQDIPLEIRGSSSSSADYCLLSGTILNICTEYEPECEKYLTKAVKLNPRLTNAWYELGECLWKREDYEIAIDCFKKSLSVERNIKSLCSLATALRQMALRTKDAQKAAELRTEASRLCAEAVELDGENATAWYALGNAYVTDFFSNGQTNPLYMKKAREAYEKALTVKDDRESLSPDLHLNYATALKFEQDFAKCLQHLFIASKLDPHFFDAKERYESLCIYLKHFSEAIQRKGKLKSKRLVEFQKALSNIPSNKSTQQQQLLSRRVYRNNAARDSDDRKEEKQLTECDFESLHEGPNEDVYIVGKVCGIVPNADTVPFTFVGCDRRGICLGFTVFNFSPKFGMIVGDTFALANPFVIDVKVDEMQCEHSKVECPLEFRLIKISSPHLMLKNDKPMSVNCIAPCELVFSTLKR